MKARGSAPKRRSPVARLPEPADDFGRWRLLVQHQSGSLEAAVARARRQNLAISFGVLLLLTVSIALLAATSRRAHRLARQQMEFVAGVSHELRTPVAVIRSAAENLSHGVVDSGDRVKRYGRLLETEARRLGEMVERVLQYAGIESGLATGARVPLAPTDIIEGAIESSITLLEPEQVTIERDFTPNPPTVVGDAAALRSAVQNLIANAVKYGGRDRWVGIKVEHGRQRRRPEVWITVSDHGDGIPASELPHIFDPFYRGADAVARQVHGNGLGLSLVRQIVAAHGGRVTVTTRAGAGSSFTIALPSAEPDQRASRCRQPVADNALVVNETNGSTALVSRRILLVEDEPGLVLTLTDRLVAEGYEVESEGDAVRGLARGSTGQLRRHPARCHAAGWKRLRRVPDAASTWNPDTDPDADGPRAGRRSRRRD